MGETTPFANRVGKRSGTMTIVTTSVWRYGGIYSFKKLCFYLNPLSGRECVMIKTFVLDLFSFKLENFLVF